MGVGLGVGLGVGFGVGLGVGFSVGTGVDCAVGRGVGAAVWVGRGVGVAVGPGLCVAGGFGSPVELDGVGWAVVTGPPVGPATAGELLASVIVGLGARSDGLGDGLGAGAELEATGLLGDGALLDPAPLGRPLGTPLDGVAVATWAISLGTAERAARCWSSTPPRPSATVARTRFRRPRLRMRRAR